MLFREAKEERTLRSAGDAMVEARDLEKTYAAGGTTVHALRGVDLRIPRGEMVAVMGPSGCGKTTLLNCLSGLDEFDSGEVLVGGESISGMSDRRRTRFRAERMGFVFQTYNLIPVLSAVENVELPLLVAGVRSKEARAGALRPADSRTRGPGEQTPDRNEWRPAAAGHGGSLSGQRTGHCLGGRTYRGARLRDERGNYGSPR